jgi:hypothetical protein
MVRSPGAQASILSIPSLPVTMTSSLFGVQWSKIFYRGTLGLDSEVTQTRLVVYWNVCVVY